MYTHCSYWDPARAARLDRLRLLVGLGLAGTEMARRLHLTQRLTERAGRPDPAERRRGLRGPARARPAGSPHRPARCGQAGQESRGWASWAILVVRNAVWLAD